MRFSDRGRTVALTRAVSPAMTRCELEHLERMALDVKLAAAQHREYEDLLRSLGCEVVSLPAEPGLPDSVFVEDAAVVLEGLAIVMRPGAESRRPETDSVAEALAAHRDLARIEEPGTLDGGDVLSIGRTLYVGRSSRSNEAGIERLGSIVAPLGLRVRPVPVRDCLHLKSAVTPVARDLLLINSRWVEREHFLGWDFVEVHPDEPHGANALLVGEALVYPASCPRTRERLEAREIEVHAIDVSEIQKAEGGVTCCSLIFEGP